MAHLFAETAEMRRDEEVGMDAGRRADRAGIEETPDAPDVGNVATVLDDGMDATGRTGSLDDGARIVRAVGERLFPLANGNDWAKAESATSRRAAGTTTSNTASGFVWSRIASRLVPIAAPARSEFAGTIACPVGVEVDKPDNTDASLSGSLEPGFAHGSAADKHDIHHL